MKEDQSDSEGATVNGQVNVKTPVPSKPVQHVSQWSRSAYQLSVKVSPRNGP